MTNHPDSLATDHEEHGGVGKYVAVFVALCFLTGASFFTCSEAWPFKSTPSIGWAFMMAVSCTKALLVILFFMHLLWEANWKYVLTIPAGMMSLFLVCMLVPDVGLRARNYSEERQVFAAEVADQGDHADDHATEGHGEGQHDAGGRDDGSHAAGGGHSD